MARLRKFTSYRGLEARAYTRISKFKQKSYVKTRPHLKITKFDSGASGKRFQLKMELVSKSDLQIRHDALESARQTCNRLLEKSLGGAGYYLKVMPYPHHILRENPTATGAGADRMSTGMKMSFGKPIGAAARVRKGNAVFNVWVNKPHVDIAKQALKKASKKLPNSYSVSIEESKGK